MSKKYLIFLFVSLLCVFPAHSADWIDERLNSLSDEEKESLTFFFRNTIKKYHLGHVLFFLSKPACLSGFFLNGTDKSKLFLKGWKTWKEKEHLFPHPNFLIYEIFTEHAEKKIVHIYFINKKTLDNHLTLYESELVEKVGPSFSKKGFIKDLEEKKIEAFKDHEGLIGFLLGYGIESSFGFQKKKQQTIFCTTEEHIEYLPTSRIELIRLKGIEVYPLTFMGDSDSPKVQSIKSQFSTELEQIETIFHRDDLLKRVLQALCG